LLAVGGIDWSTTPTRVVVRSTGQPEAREERTLQHHADALAYILDTLQAGPAAPLPRVVSSAHTGLIMLGDNPGARYRSRCILRYRKTLLHKTFSSQGLQGGEHPWQARIPT
jgi:hypothetical protein